MCGLVAGVGFACGDGNQPSPGSGSASVASASRDPATRATSVRTYGSLRDMFHAGDIGPKVALDRLLPDSTLVAVGALSELRGEVTILRGVAHLAYPEGPSRTQSTSSPTESATLLVASQVAAWDTVQVRAEVAFAMLDSTIEALARRAGVHTAQAFPFVVQARMRDAAWHVIDGSRLRGGGGSHEEHRRAAVVHTVSEATMTLVGFHSSRHAGVFTHRDSRTHVHGIEADTGSSGHLDAGTILPGSLLLFPRAVGAKTVP